MSIDRGINKEEVIHTHTLEYYSTIGKKNHIPPFATTCIDLEIVILSEGSQTQKDKYHMSLLCGIWKRGANELIYRTEVESSPYINSIITRMLSAALVKVHVRGSWVYS